jgi:hypothetical protein
MMPTSKPQDRDQDIHKGAVEGDKARDQEPGNPLGDGIDDQGMPDDPIATAEDEIGANEDESQG